MSNLSELDLAEKMLDKNWRMANLYYIKNKAGKRVKFQPNKTQKRLSRSKSRFNATLKGRQQGVSTYYILRYLDEVLYNDNITVAIISHDRESIKKLFRIVQYAYKYLDDNIKPRLAKGGGSKYEYYFPENESRIYVALEVTSDSVQKLHVSEYGLMKDKDRYEASIEAVPWDIGEISIESTPRGLNHFYDDWVDVDWDFKKHFFPWYFHHENKLSLSRGEKIEYTEDELELIAKAKKHHKIKITKQQIKWRRSKYKSAKFLREHPEDDQTCFMASGSNPLEVEDIKNQLQNLQKPLRKVKSTVIYEEFDKSELYICGADTAGGTGGDYYVGSIWRVRDWVQCAQIRNNKWRPKVFAEKLHEMCKLYASSTDYPLLGVERNNHGHAVLLALEEIEKYPNLFYHENLDDKIGWNTTPLTRPPMVDQAIEAITAKVLKIRSKELLGECLTLVDNEGKIEAQEGKHDDCFMAAAIAVQLLMGSAKLDLWNNLGDLVAVD